jgi:hypothetical protein
MQVRVPHTVKVDDAMDIARKQAVQKQTEIYGRNGRNPERWF